MAGQQPLCKESTVVQGVSACPEYRQSDPLSGFHSDEKWQGCNPHRIALGLWLS